MTPSHQRLRVELASAAAQHDFRLIRERQLVVVDRLAQIAQQRQPVAAVLVLVLVPYGGAAVGALCRVHRDVRATQQRRALGAVLRKDRDPDAATDVDHVALKRRRQLEHMLNRLGETPRVVDVSSGQKHGELVASETRHDVHLVGRNGL